MASLGRRTGFKVADSATNYPGLHAIVLNYCQLHETLGCVDALTQAGVPETRILVVDNASPDGSGDALEAELDGPRLLCLPENEGFGAGNNAAIETLWRSRDPKPTHVFIVNPDVRVSARTLKELMAVLATDPRRGGATCVQLDPGNPDRLDPIFRGWLEKLGLEVADLEDRSFIPTETLLGAAMMLTREAIERVGGFDPLYFMYAEEEDLARRLRYHEFEIGVACNAKVTHGRPYLSVAEEDGRRTAQRRTSRYLFVLKDPLHTLAFNVYRVLDLGRLHLGQALTRDDVTLRDWWKELAWVGRRIFPGLRHRRWEMRGRAHVKLAAADASTEERAD